MAKELTQDEALRWLKTNESLLNISGIARRLKMDQSNLRKTIKGVPDTHGTMLKIPVKYLPELTQIMKELSTK